MRQGATLSRAPPSASHDPPPSGTYRTRKRRELRHTRERVERKMARATFHDTDRRPQNVSQHWRAARGREPRLRAYGNAVSHARCSPCRLPCALCSPRALRRTASAGLAPCWRPAGALLAPWAWTLSRGVALTRPAPVPQPEVSRMTAFKARSGSWKTGSGWHLSVAKWA